MTFLSLRWSQSRVRTPQPTPCHAIHQREPGRAAACMFILTTGSYDHVSRVAPSQHTENGPASAGPRARRSAPSPKTDRPSDRGGVKTAGPGGGNTLITRESRDQPDTNRTHGQRPRRVLTQHTKRLLHLQPHNPMSLSPVHAGFQSPPPGRSLFRAVRRRKVSETAPSFDVL